MTFLHLDLSDFKSIAAAVETFTAESDRLDILLNNAGVMALPYSKTTQDYEIQFGTNHVGHALFTKLLLPTLLKTAAQPDPSTGASTSDVRVVNVTSLGHRFAPSGPGNVRGINYDQQALEGCNTFTRYGQSKLANILHARSLREKYPQLTAVALHPGVILTDLYKSQEETNFVVRWGLKAVGGFVMADVKSGALNQLWACTAPKDQVRKAVYYVPVGVATSGTAFARDDKVAEELWNWTEGEFVKHGY